jgi:heavy metal translocating P-type ATPase
VNYATERAAVSAPTQITDAALCTAVVNAGYEVQVVTSLPPSRPGEEARLRARQLLRRLVVVAILAMPLMDFSLAAWLLPSIRFPGWQWLLLALASPVVTWGAAPFYIAAWRQARHGTWTMDTLVALGILSSTSWSIYAMFFQPDRGAFSFGQLFTHHATGAIYVDVAVGVTGFLLLGRYVEARMRMRTGDALGSLAALRATSVTLLDSDGRESLCEIDALMVGEHFVVRPGDSVATDGVVIDGQSNVDARAMTGESEPQLAAPGFAVIGGTVNLDGRLVVAATAVGRDTQLAQMVRLVEDAQNQKANIQRLADRLAGVLVPVVLGLSVVTLLGWFLAGAAAATACNAALSVLIIACPCSLGLATPAALLVAAGVAADHGVFFKGFGGIETSRHVDTVLFDKTGTVTTGVMSVVDVRAVEGASPDEVVMMAASVEVGAAHPIADAIVSASRARGQQVVAARNVTVLAGVGASGRVGESDVVVSTAHDVPDAWAGAGWTAVRVQRDGINIGIIALSDVVRDDAASTVAALHRDGLRVLLVTGDNERAAATMARAVGVDEVIAGALPAEKVAVLARLRNDGRTVAMVGDGINDSPVLAAADVGIALASGTEAAVAAADIVVLRGDLGSVVFALRLARRTLRTIRGNLAWAFVYNVVAIPIAALGYLNPLVAGAAMASSSLFVVANSARIRQFSLEAAPRAR